MIKDYLPPLPQGNAVCEVFSRANNEPGEWM